MQEFIQEELKASIVPLTEKVILALSVADGTLSLSLSVGWTCPS